MNMKKILMTMALSAAFTGFGFAQGLGSGQTASGSSQAQSAGTPSSTSPSQSGSMSDQNSAVNSSNQMSGEKTLHGCIESENGGYTLEQKNGKEVMLSGSEDFSKHVGHEVKVHGMWGSASNSSASSASGASSPSSASTNPSDQNAGSESNSGKTFNVDKLDMVSEQCSIKK